MPFGVIAGVLLARNGFIFSTPMHEEADMAADSILIEQARHFSLLVGNYSREGFNHPGPAFLYVQSWGESLFWAALRLVPTAWNGQLIAVYALNALFAALVVATGYGWTRSVRGAVAVCAVVLSYGAVHPAMFSSDWMPYLYVPAYFCFLVAVASVAAGRVRDAWIGALSGWFLIHGHACFLFFVPFLTGCAVAALAWPWRRSPGSSLRRFLGGQRRAWVPPAVISALFLAPIAVQLALRWPGDFGKYFSYGSSSHTGGHSAVQVARYMLWFWWPGRAAWLVPVVAYLAAGGLTWRLRPGPVRRFLISLLAFSTLSSAAFACYTAVGIDALGRAGYYIGYFYWSAPAVMSLVAAVAVVEALPSLPGLAVAVLAGAAACAAFAVAPQTRTSTGHVDPENPAISFDTDPALPAGIARMSALSGGKPVVLRFTYGVWPEITGLLVQAERTGVRACVANPYWEFMMTSQFICTQAEVSAGTPYGVYPPGAVPPGEAVVARLRRAIVTGTAK